VKAKSKAVSSKLKGKRSEVAKAAAVQARSRTKTGRASVEKTSKTASAGSKASSAASSLNPKQVEAKLQTKSEPKNKMKAPVREPAPDLTLAAAEAQNAPARPAAETPAVKAAQTSGREQKPVSREAPAAAPKAKPGVPRPGFKLNEYVVYPAHGVGQIVAIEEQEVAGFKLELFVISFSKDKMTLRVPTSKGAGVGMRKISDPETAKRSLEILTGRARIKRTMWSRRAQEYEAKINSGDINAIAEVVRDLYRSDAQPEQSYSERQLYEAALDRIVREIAAVQKISEIDALRAVEAQLQRNQARSKAAAASGDSIGPEIEEAA
jgi:CarD family transcriptional regulator